MKARKGFPQGSEGGGREGHTVEPSQQSKLQDNKPNGHAENEIPGLAPTQTGQLTPE